MSPIPKRGKVNYLSQEWYRRLLSGVETESGKNCTLWHLNKLSFGGYRSMPLVPWPNRQNLIQWINDGVVRTKNYQFARIALAINICKTTTGLTGGDTRYFINRMKEIVPPIDHSD